MLTGMLTRALCGRPDAPLDTCLLSQCHVCWGFNTGPGVRQHRGRNNSEEHFRGLASHTGPNWKHLCKPRNGNPFPPAPENIHGCSHRRTGESRNADSRCLVCRPSPKWDENVEYLKAKVLVQARWAPAWDRLVVRKSFFFSLYENKNKLAEAVFEVFRHAVSCLKKKKKDWTDVYHQLSASERFTNLICRRQ